MTTATANQETTHGIEVRRMDIAFTDAIPKLWFDDNALLTCLFSALSVGFPSGERFFVQSVLHYLPEIEDADLRSRVRAFVGQEANHTKEHLAFDRFLDARGFPAAAMEESATRRMARMQKTWSPEAKLACTAALEHFTAILGAALLEHPEVAERTAPEVARLWVWHAIEEIEHRSVAFDVYKSKVDDEKLRVRMMRAVTVFLVFLILVRTVILLHSCGRLFDVSSYAIGAKILFGRDGLLRGIGPRYRAYFARDYHPSHLDGDALVEAAKQRYLGAAA